MRNSGYIIVHKPSGITSHDVIDFLRKVTGVRRIGHAGTLDPFATGVLFVGIGREATRNLGKFVGLDKRYRATLTLGATSDTYDREGEIKKVNYEVGIVNQEEIQKVLQSFAGKQKQIPPQYSAKKIQGKKAYELAREGQKVKLKPQNIEIYSITIRNSSFVIRDSLSLDIHCSSGTYIRSLAHDIGQKLGCGAYLEELERGAVGNLTLEEAIDLEKINTDNWHEHVIHFKTVMAQGTFEKLHPGHEFYLKEAKKLGEKLVVVIARDTTALDVRGRKLRHDENERLTRVQSFDFVDEARLGNETDPYQSVVDINPDIIALGYDQKVFVPKLEEELVKRGLKTKIARIGAHLPEKFKSSKIS